MADVSSLSFAFVCWVCAAAWLSGAIFGWGLRETIAFLRTVRTTRRRAARVDAPPKAPASAPEPARRRTKKYRRGYYYSEEARSWGDRSWRGVAGWITVVLIGALLASSAVVAAISYKSHRPAAGARPH